MINKKKIEEAAKEEMPEFLFSKRQDLNFIKGFMAGINWFKDNLWHDASEEPKPIKEGMFGVGCLVRYKSGVFEYGEQWFGDGFNEWYDVLTNEPIRQELIESWLYIKDLLKGGK